jgi:hypothetical protein
MGFGLPSVLNAMRFQQYNLYCANQFNFSNPLDRQTAAKKISKGAAGAEANVYNGTFKVPECQKRPTWVSKMV